MIAKLSLIGFRPLLILAAISLSLLFLTSRDVSATTFGPDYTLCIDNATTTATCDGDSSPGAAADARTTFGITAPKANFGAVVSYTPSAFLAGANQNIPLGAVVGKLFSQAVLGLINNPCNNNINVEFTFFYSSLNIADTISPLPPGSPNALSPLAKDANGNGLPDAVDKYPSYLNFLFDPDLDRGPDGLFGTGDDVNGPQSPPTPAARATGFTIPAGTGVQVVLIFVLFAPGTTLPDLPAPDQSLGFPSVTVLQDPTAPPAPSAITDFCSPLDVSAFNFATTRDNPCTPPPGPSGCPSDPEVPPPFTINADPQGCDGPGPAQPDPDNNEASCLTRKNPDAGTYNFTIFARSLRDADDDGHENFLDTCNQHPTPAWNPRAGDTDNDPDSDGLPGKDDNNDGTVDPDTGCDPFPFQPSSGSAGCPQGTFGPDQENDCYPNRGDNCPLIINDQIDTDGDTIGNPCDPNPNEDTGHSHEGCVSVAITVGGAGGSTPKPFAEDPNCVVAGITQGPGAGPGATGPGGTGPGGTGPGGTGGTRTGGGAGGPGTGVGSLAPVAASIPAWAAIAAGLGGAGFLGALGAIASRFLRRRR